MEHAEIVPSEGFDGPTKRKYQGVCVKVYFDHEDFAEVAQLAEKAGKRRVGLALYTKKKHGFGDEKLANTDGIARFLKMTAEYWKDHQEELRGEFTKWEKQGERLKKYGMV